jgi:hypothetical protein
MGVVPREISRLVRARAPRALLDRNGGAPSPVVSGAGICRAWRTPENLLGKESRRQFCDPVELRQRRVCRPRVPRPMGGSGGVVVVVSRTISATVSSGIDGLRPRPSRIFSSPAGPSSVNRFRHPCLKHLPMEHRHAPRQLFRCLTLTVRQEQHRSWCTHITGIAKGAIYLRDTPPQ